MQVQSHAIPNVVVETGDMRRINLYLLITIALFSFVTLSVGFQVTLDSLKTSDQINAISREKRQLEDFENDYPTPSAQASEVEPSFWDRVVNVAVRLFSKFIEWLNSS